MLYHLKELVVYFLKSMLSNLSFYLQYRNNLIYESIFGGEFYQRLLKNLVGIEFNFFTTSKK